MKPYYAEALAGTLKSAPFESPSKTLTIKNYLNVIVSFFYVIENGDLFAPPDNKILPFKDGIFTAPYNDGSFIVLKNYVSGAFIGVIALNKAMTAFYVGSNVLSLPNDIGPIPEPTLELVIPRDSQPVVVGYGTYGSPTKQTIVREQSWQKMTDSYTLAPREKRTVGSTCSSGMTQTTSTEEQVSESLNMSASAGWGPISTQISMSLNTSTSVMQSYTISKEESSYESSEITNNNDFAVMNIRWQLVDTITVYNEACAPVSSIVSRVPPSVVKNYNLENIPAGPVLMERSLSDQEWILEQLKITN